MRARVLCVPLLFITSLVLARPASTVEPLSSPPPDVASARRLHAPPRVVVQVRTVNEPPKDGPCKDPVCFALALTFMAIEKAFPKQHDVVTVMVDGKPRFHGNYEVEGGFLHGYVDSPQGTRRFERMKLPRLGRTLIVETGRRGPGPEGREEKLEPRLPVEELLADYRRALASTKDAERRGGLISEALWVLREPALPWVLERLEDPAEADEVKASVIAAGCDVRGSRPLGGEQVGPLVHAALRTTPGEETLGATVECRLARKQTIPRSLMGALVAGFCRAEALHLEGRAYTMLSRLKNEGSPALDPTPLFDDSCEQPARRAVLRTCLGNGAEREEYAAAFTAKDESGKAVLQCLQEERPEHRVGFEEAFRASPWERLAWVEGRDTPLEAWELEALARHFDKHVRPYWKRARVLDLFAQAAGEPERTALARSALHELARKAEQEEKDQKAKDGSVMRFLKGVQHKVVGPASSDGSVTVRIALVVLGEVDETPRAALGLPREPHPIAQTSVNNVFDLAAYAFTRVGCTRAELQAASRRVYADKPLPPGAWCASQTH